MKKISILILVFISLLTVSESNGQEYQWEFKKETKGIKVYTRDIANSNLKALKIIMDVEVSVNAIMSLLMNTASYPEWVYKCSYAGPVTATSILNTVDYYQIDFPWPFSDRDLYTHTITTVDPETGVITSTSTGMSDYGPERTGFVRVPTHFNQWIITPISPTQTHLEYFLQSTPGGSIPNWLVNLAADQGPIKSMQAFFKLAKRSPYAESGEWLTDQESLPITEKKE